jgi:NAD(P)-dependent dehydrogenase (short-subunit alcohol dehydrogenase family)
MGKLEGKVVVITGGSSGIGEAAVKLFAQEGARIVIGDILDDRGQVLAEALGDGIVYQHTDVSSEKDIQALIRISMDQFGKLDCMFNNAGFAGVFGPVENTDMAAFDFTVSVLFKGVMMGMKHAARVMIPQGFGNIISTASIAGHKTGYGPHTYSACKAAVIHLTRSVAMQLGPLGIRVNCICPGGIATPIFGRLAGMSQEQAEKTIEPIKEVFKKTQAIPRSGLPEDIAKAALFLASDDAGFINGEALHVDGAVGRGFMDPQDRSGQREGLLKALGFTLDPG